MQVWPAIDLRGGKCVRLRQGDYDRETVFDDDPAAVARRFENDGAQFLHLVDLDGARAGQVENWDSIKSVLATTKMTCELGGGIRDRETIEKLLGLGLGRIVIGTQAIKRPDWFREMCRAFPGKLALGIDARNGRVATHGWLETSEVLATTLAKDFAREPIASIIYTDIDTDGMLSGPNLTALDEMRRAVDVPVISSGGVARAEDISALAALPMAGVIVGRALYEGTLSLVDALARARTASHS